MTAVDPDHKEKTFECELSTSAKEGEKQFTGEKISEIVLRFMSDIGITSWLLYLSYMFTGKTLTRIQGDPSGGEPGLG